jgi:hypothetical protein
METRRKYKDDQPLKGQFLKIIEDEASTDNPRQVPVLQDVFTWYFADSGQFENNN